MGQLRINVEGYGFTPQTRALAAELVAGLRADGASLSTATLQHNDEPAEDLLVPTSAPQESPLAGEHQAP